MTTHTLSADHAELGRLFAAWDPNARHVEPRIHAHRFSARLAPFPDREAAELALIDAGAVLGGDDD